MKNRELFDKTVGILVSAYINDTLQAMNCNACVVGNLIAATQGFTYTKHDSIFGRSFASWVDRSKSSTNWVYALHPITQERHAPTTEELTRGQEWLTSTGYSNEQLANIEKAFESNSSMLSTDTYKGLVAVYNLLLEIHEADLTTESKAEEVFVKPTLIEEAVVA